MKTVFLCENCNETWSSKGFIFRCHDCAKEICDSCMRGWATCKECGVGKTDEELAKRFDIIYD